MGKVRRQERSFYKGRIPVLVDSFGRVLDYLRVSITDRCNLRCVYCMPPDGVNWKPHESMLTFEEILRLVKIMAGLGVRKIKVTGGEPLVRRGTASFLKSLKAVPKIVKVTITTNGFLLEKYLDEAEAISPGSMPDGVNISMDALDEGRFSRIARTENLRPEEILPNIDRLLGKKIPVKINCVAVRGFNEEEIIPLALLAKDRNITVRFIELMPMGSAVEYEPVPGDEIASVIEKAFGRLSPFSGVEGSGPAVYYSLQGFAGKIGFINPLSHGFCESCNRLRLTSEGSLKLCLSAALALDLREPLRSGASDEDLVKAITEAAIKKPQFHNLSGVYSGEQTCGGTRREGRDGMFSIGG